MLHQKLVFAFLASFAIATCGIDSATGQEIKFALSDYKGGNSLTEAELQARKFIATPANKGASDVLKAEYFVSAVAQDYTVTDGKQRLSNSNYIVAGLLIAKSMREFENANKGKASDDLFRLWMPEQTKLLTSLRKSKPAVLTNAASEAWNQFLLKWTEDAKNSGKFGEALQEAPFYLLEAILEVRRDQEESAQSTTGTSGGSLVSTSRSTGASGASSPMHERLMNHIYHHNDRRVQKAERIRARR